MTTDRNKITDIDHHATTYSILVGLIQQMRMHGMQQLNGLRVSTHSCQMQRVSPVMVPVEQCSSIQEKLDYPRVALTGGDVEGGEPFTITFVDDESALVGVQELASGVVAAVTGKDIGMILLIIILF